MYSTPTITKSNLQDNFLQLPAYFMKLHTTHTQQTLPATPQLHVTSPKLLTSIALIWCMHSLQSCSHKFELRRCSWAHSNLVIMFLCASRYIKHQWFALMLSVCATIALVHACPPWTHSLLACCVHALCSYTTCSLRETTSFCCVELRVSINSLYVLSLFIRILVGLK